MGMSGEGSEGDSGRSNERGVKAGCIIEGNSSILGGGFSGGGGDGGGEVKFGSRSSDSVSSSSSSSLTIRWNSKRDVQNF
jgi:hypothetical protein